MRKRAWAALALAALVATPVCAQIYKWVDEKGVTHFSETPPPDRKASRIEVKPTPPSSDAKPDPGNWKERELEFRQRHLEKERTEEAARRREEYDAAVRKQRCSTAQYNLEILRRGPVYSVNERGERVYVEDKDRPKRVEEWKRVAEANCVK